MGAGQGAVARGENDVQVMDIFFLFCKSWP